MSRPENSALIALAGLKSLESARADEEASARRAAAERAAREQEEAQRLAAEQGARVAADAAARAADHVRRQETEAAEAQRRIAAAEAAARAEHEVRLLELQRDLQTELERRERRRTGRVIGYGMGAAALATLMVVGAWFALPDTAVSAPLAVDAPNTPTRDLAGELAELRRQNAAIRRDMRDAAERSEAIVADAAATSDSQAEAQPKPTSKRPKRPRPKRPRRPRTQLTDEDAAQDAPLIKPRDNPVVFDETGRAPLSGLGKKDSK